MMNVWAICFLCCFGYTASQQLSPRVPSSQLSREHTGAKWAKSEKRSDDSDPNAILIQQLASRLDAVEAQLSASRTEMTTKVQDLQSQLDAEKQARKQLEDELGHQVAFSAYINHEPNVPASEGSIVPFGGIITNVGNGYDASTSAFTAPYSGDYMFFVHADISSSYRAFNINKNGHGVAFCHNDGGITRLACGVVLNLHAGDKVTVVHAIESNGVIDAGQESVFTGFRVR